MARKLLSSLALALLSSIALHAGATPTAGISITGGVGGTSDGPWTLGYQFQVTNSITVTALGAYDFDGDGFLASHDVGLWDASGNLLASTVVGNSDGLSDMFRYRSISGVALTAGQTYYVGANNYGVGGDNYLLRANITSSPDITYLDGAYVSSGALAFPFATFSDGGYFGANFQYGEASGAGDVPEPASLGLIVAGLLGMARLRRKQAN